MKNRLFNAFLLLAMVGVMFTACKKEYPQPPIQDLPIGRVYTIDSLVKMGTHDFKNEDASVYGIVTADEQSGNLYKCAFMQDRATGAAIELYLKAPSGVRIGDSIRVYLRDVTLALYNGLPQLSNFEADGHIIILANNKPIEPALTSISEIKTGKFLAGLVRLENVWFTEQATFADPTTYGNRFLVDEENPFVNEEINNKFVVRTSNYANFAYDPLPSDTGNLVAIASIYNNTWQLIIRSRSEVDFHNFTPGGGGQGVVPGEVQSLPYSQSFYSEFGTYMTYDVSGNQFWEIDYHTAKMTGYAGNTYNANEDWLISSPVAITGVNDAKMTMSYIGRYFNNINEEVTIWASTDYTWGSDPTTANWRYVPANLTEASNWSDFLTAEIPLTEYVGQTVTFAVKYTSTDSKAGTMEIQSITIEEGTGGGGGGGGQGGELQAMPYTQSFASEFGTYCTYDVLGPQCWVIDYNTAKMTGYSGGSHANEDWLISSPVAVTGVDNAKVSVTYSAQYQNADETDITMQVSTDYVYGSDPSTATWTRLPIAFPNTSSFNDFQTVETSLNDFIGQNVYVAIKYTSTDAQSRTIEVQSITVQEGQAGGGGGGGQGGDLQSMPYTQSFTDDFGTYTTYDFLGPQSWIIDFHTAKMTGYASGSNNANEDWLLSSPVAVTGVSEAKVSVTYVAQYQNNDEYDITLQVSTDYVYGSNPTAATWKQMSATYPNTSNWNDFQTVETSLNDFIGQNVTVAIKFTSTTSQSRTIEVQSITVQEGQGGGGGGGQGGDVQSLPYTQSFTDEFGTYTTYDVLGAQSWMIDYHTAKMTGYSGGSHANEDWLLSAPVALTGVNTVKALVTYVAQYQGGNDDISLEVSADYVAGNPTAATWTKMPTTYPNTSNWNDFQTVETDLSAFVGQTVTVAIKYTSTDSQSRTIEVQSITIQ